MPLIPDQCTPTVAGLYFSPPADRGWTEWIRDQDLQKIIRSLRFPEAIGRLT